MSKKIGTHDGTFHVDEALACYMLLLTNEFKNAEIVRSRDKEVLKTLDVIVDVGGEYDTSRHRYDHHQPSFTSTFDDSHNIKLSSAGLIYKHFAKEIIASTLGTDEALTEKIHSLVYDKFMEPIDAIDNGISAYPSDLKPKYTVSTDLSSRVSHLNPDWYDEAPKPNEQFRKAMEMAGSELMERINYYGKSWLPARKYVKNAVDKRFDVDPSGEIIVLERFCPWKSHLYEIEKEEKLPPTIKYALFADQNAQSWRVSCVSADEGSFVNRKSLPKAWRGLRDEELSTASGIPGCVFVHMSGFIGGNKSYEGALKMAQLAVAEKEES